MTIWSYLMLLTVGCGLLRKLSGSEKQCQITDIPHSNINPNHIIEESSITNRSRINCFLYIDARLTQTELPRQNADRPADAYIQRVHAVLAVEMNQCRLIHSTRRCEFHWDAWMQDHPVNNANMAQVYAALTESEAEADERLTSDEWDEDDEGDTVLPASSF